jgi:hypothetical protein
VGSCCEPRGENSWYGAIHAQKVWLDQRPSGSRKSSWQAEGPGRPIKLRHRETRAHLTRRRGLRLDGIPGIKKQALPLPAHRLCFVSFRFDRHSLVCLYLCLCSCF